MFNNKGKNRDGITHIIKSNQSDERGSQDIQKRKKYMYSQILFAFCARYFIFFYSK